MAYYIYSFKIGRTWVDVIRPYPITYTRAAFLARKYAGVSRTAEARFLGETVYVPKRKSVSRSTKSKPSPKTKTQKIKIARTVERKKQIDVWAQISRKSSLVFINNKPVLYTPKGDFKVDKELFEKIKKKYTIKTQKRTKVDWIKIKRELIKHYLSPKKTLTTKTVTSVKQSTLKSSTKTTKTKTQTKGKTPSKAVQVPYKNLGKLTTVQQFIKSISGFVPIKSKTTKVKKDLLQQALEKKAKEVYKKLKPGQKAIISVRTVLPLVFKKFKLPAGKTKKLVISKSPALLEKTKIQTPEIKATKPVSRFSAPKFKTLQPIQKVKSFEQSVREVTTKLATAYQKQKGLKRVATLIGGNIAAGAVATATFLPSLVLKPKETIKSTVKGFAKLAKSPVLAVKGIVKRKPKLLEEAVGIQAQAIGGLAIGRLASVATPSPATIIPKRFTTTITEKPISVTIRAVKAGKKTTISVERAYGLVAKPKLTLGQKAAVALGLAKVPETYAIPKRVLVLEKAVKTGKIEKIETTIIPRTKGATIAHTLPPVGKGVAKFREITAQVAGGKSLVIRKGRAGIPAPLRGLEELKRPVKTVEILKGPKEKAIFYEIQTGPVGFGRAAGVTLLPAKITKAVTKEKVIATAPAVGAGVTKVPSELLKPAIGFEKIVGKAKAKARLIETPLQVKGLKEGYTQFKVRLGKVKESVEGVAGTEMFKPAKAGVTYTLTEFVFKGTRRKSALDTTSLTKTKQITLLKQTEQITALQAKTLTKATFTLPKVAGFATAVRKSLSNLFAVTPTKTKKSTIAITKPSITPRLFKPLSLTFEIAKPKTKRKFKAKTKVKPATFPIKLEIPKITVKPKRKTKVAPRLTKIVRTKVLQKLSKAITAKTGQVNLAKIRKTILQRLSKLKPVKPTNIFKAFQRTLALQLPVKAPKLKKIFRTPFKPKLTFRPFFKMFVVAKPIKPEGTTAGFGRIMPFRFRAFGIRRRRIKISAFWKHPAKAPLLEYAVKTVKELKLKKKVKHPKLEKALKEFEMRGFVLGK